MDFASESDLRTSGLIGSPAALIPSLAHRDRTGPFNRSCSCAHCAHRYQAIGFQRKFRGAAGAHEVKAINQIELEEAMAPVPRLADQLQELAPQIDGYFDTLIEDRPAFEFHGGALVSGFTAQANWLGELLLHSHDVARAVNAPLRAGLTHLRASALQHGLAVGGDVVAAGPELPGRHGFQP